MTKQEIKEQAQQIVERGKELAEENNQRYLVLRKADGSEVFETSVTVAAGVALFLLVTGFLSWPLILIAAIAAYASKVKVELRQDSQAISQE